MADTDLSKSAKRFIGDKKTMIVHDMSKGSCSVDQEEAVPFDTVDEAHVAGFGNCKKCLRALLINPIWSGGVGGFQGGGPGPNTGGGTYGQKDVQRGTIKNKMVTPPETK